MSTTTDIPSLHWHAVYTRALREAEVARALGGMDSVSEVLLPVFNRLKPRREQGVRVIDLHEAMFPNYVLFRASLDRDTLREIMRVEAVQYVLGTQPDRPSPIPDAEIQLVRHLADCDRDPRLGEEPLKGRVARVVAGPLRGVEGLVLWRNQREARLATRVKLAAGSFEIRLPLDVLALSRDCQWSTGEPVMTRHRGGRRGRRSGSVAA